jgi:hypothetical protein
MLGLLRCYKEIKLGILEVDGLCSNDVYSKALLIWIETENFSFGLQDF